MDKSIDDELTKMSNEATANLTLFLKEKRRKVCHEDINKCVRNFYMSYESMVNLLKTDFEVNAFSFLTELPDRFVLKITVRK